MRVREIRVKRIRVNQGLGVPVSIALIILAEPLELKHYFFLTISQ